ncbi:HAD-IC family P-type ATPase [Candidatus Saccharibacteria bacterium]|nr:HAD-IC family P-type ATPase [Candidatus Saccharibacteria bacterium]
MSYYDKDISEVQYELGTSELGLRQSEVRERRAKYGANILPKKKKDGIIKIFFREFLDPMILLLLVAIAASIIAGEYVDAIVIAVIILADAVMGAYQENRANNTAESLANYIKVKVRVLRDGEIEQIDAEELVPGDYILLESGDKISADARIVEAQNFTADESILTGESVPVSKISNKIRLNHAALGDQRNMVFSGTTVISGRAKAIVVGTGLNTELGKIADTLNRTEKAKSPLTQRVEKFSRQITGLIIVIAIIITALLYAKGYSHAEVLITVIAFAVSAMPEGLPLALTMALSIASNRMARKNVIVRKLNAAESLGSCTVIASDKTGTLTVNQQTAKKIILPNGDAYDITGTGLDTAGKIEGEDPEKVAPLCLLGALNNEAELAGEKSSGDSIDLAFLVLAKKAGASTRAYKIVDRIPYESANKYSAVFYEVGGKTYCTVKGSPEVVAKFCSNQKIVKQSEQLAADGYRVIALASAPVATKANYSAKDIKSLKFAGLVGFIDPIRKEAITSIRDCHRAGIRVLMITGDHPLTATSIARELKLIDDDAQVTSSEEVEQYYLRSEQEFDDFVARKIVFARVTPLQKLHIVESLKRQGEFVAVTGDGVNDAPALKAANIGVAMGSGTDIARETSDMIIADDNFKSIVAGIKEGRVAYANIRKIVFFLISCNLAETIFFCLAIAFDMPMPFVAVQLLWLNVVTDGIQDFALSFEKAEKDILHEKPRNTKESIFNRSLMTQIAYSALVITGVIFGAYYYFINVAHYDVVTSRSLTMCLMVFIQNIHALSCRSEKQSAFKISLRSNPVFLFGIAGTLLLQLIVMGVPFLSQFLQTVPLEPLCVLALIGIAFTILVAVELYKLFVRIISKQ